MPTRILAVYAEALPVVRAQASLEGVTVAAVGTGTMKKAARDEVLRDWRRVAQSFATPVKPNAAALRRLAAASGIGVRVEKRRPSG